MLKRIIDHIMTGVAIAFVITNVVMGIFANDVSGQQAIQTYILWMFAGMLYGGISLIYDTKISKKIAMPLHFAMNLALSLVAFRVMFSNILNITMEFSWVWVVAVFVVAYIVIATCIYLYDKISVKSLNKKLQKN